MEELITSRISWFKLLVFCLLLLGGYFLLRLLDRLLDRLSFAWLEQSPIRSIVHRMQVVYEPAALLIVASLFFMVRPLSNGLIILLSILATFSHIRNYFSGKLLALQDSLEVGKHLHTADIRGRVARMGRLGLRLQTNEGLHYIDYNRLLNQGYALLAGEEIGGLYRLRIQAREASGKKPDRGHILDLLATAPYPEWNHTPELLRGREEDDFLEARVLMREEDHLYELTRLINEWGYACQVVREA